MSSWAKPGVKAVCINKAGWFETSTGEDCDGPGYKEVVTLASYPFVDEDDGVVSVLVVGYPAEPGSGYPLSVFRPLITRTQSEDVALIKSLLVGDEVSA